MNFVSREKIGAVRKELVQHLPFTFFGAAAGILLLGILQLVLAEGGMLPGRFVYEDLFHIFHGFHLLFSAIASTAVYYRYHPNLAVASLVGFITTIIPCGLSDIGIPYLGGFFLGARLEFHWCLIEEPGLVFPFVILGIIGGIVGARNLTTTSYFSHGTHVLISSFASTFYFVSFGLLNWAPLIGGIFAITVLAVIIPCCLSDIVLPISAAPDPHSH